MEDPKNLAKLKKEYEQSSDALVAKITEKAKAICDKRQEKANAVKKSLDLIEAKKQESDLATSAIQSKLQFVVDCDKEIKVKIRNKCSDIEELWKNYHHEALDLYERFQHKKIKIISYGEPGQGKSTFVKLLTKLPDEVVAVHPPHNGLEKTGAVNVIHYDKVYKPDNPKIHVHFKTAKQFLDQFVNALEGLKVVRFCGVNTTDLSLDDVKTHIGKECVFEHNDGKESVFKGLDSKETTLSGANGLVLFIGHALDKNACLDDLDDAIGKDIDKTQIPIYNDIQFQGRQRWMAVKRIDIYASFGEGEMFNYFDICDTKGIGVDAGGDIAERETFEELRNSDAAFSIAQISSNNKDMLEKFYDKTVRPFCEKTPAFISRNFIISNKKGETTQSTVDKFIDNIRIQNVAKICYDGKLVDSQNPKEPEDFVKYIVLDMLGSIVDVVEEEDKRLMENCNRFAAAIQASITELGELLHSFEVENINIDDILIQIIKDISEEADKAMLKEFFKGQQPDQQQETVAATQSKPKGDGYRDDGRQQNSNRSNSYSSEGVEYSEQKYKDIIKENKEALSVYQLLTGEKEDGNYRQKGVNEAIEASVEFLMKKAKESVNEKAKGNSNDIGRYIDAISDFYRKTFQERAGQHVPQSVIDTKEIKDSIISVAWKKLYLDKLLGNFDKSILERYKYNLRIGQLLDAYNKDAWDSGEEPFRWIMSYDVLYAYFSSNPPRSGVSYLEYSVDENSLKKAIAKCLNSKANNFIKFLIDRGVNIKERIQYTVYRYTYESLLDLESQPYDLLPLYKNNIARCVKEGLLPPDYEKRINQSDAKSEMDGKLEQLSHLVVPLVQQETT